MAEKYPGWSPYNYTLQNPVNFTDPTRMVVESVQKPLDDYGYDKNTGELFLIRKTKDNFDRIFTGEKKASGLFMPDGDYKDISKGVLSGEFGLDYSKEGMIFRGGSLDEGLQAMKFLSFKSSKEFSAWAFDDKSIGGKGLALSPWSGNTMSQSWDYYASSKKVGNMVDFGKKLFHIHTHPGGSPGYGYGYPSKSFDEFGNLNGGDLLHIKKNPSLPHYILSKHHGVTRYYPIGGKQAQPSNDLDTYLNSIIIRN
ncbi:hypothetical protein FVB9532_00285 [Mesonia oceanica]|uniref:Uncharacterized protein n=1 Tax=Mesonia oceanica TaxID=2687242 RepID=A0AC61Y3J2_9FLAO|nr:hypothetical protein FVB9532_00285 [Mesonia oceanica]